MTSLVVLVAGLLTGPAPARAAAPDIVDQLRQVPGLTVVEEGQVAEPYRFFTLTYTQPADHRRPRAGTFQQRLTLLYRATDRPTVLHTTGYGVPGYAFRSEPTRLIDGNQISVEQRFFTPSRPEPADWHDLNIWQAATDHHRLVRALKTVFPQKWISTGASKGGMTSVYHRRFYPADVDGTVAYVAPQDATESDAAYDRFFTRVGTDPACRAALDAVQTEALKRRKRLVATYQAWAATNNRTFTIVHSADRAFEFMVNGAPWAFWQYSLQADCPTVPPVTATDDELMTWLDEIYGLDSNTDQGITPYVPYYYQAATELNYPEIQLRHLRRLQNYPGQDVAETYVPADLPTRFRPEAMKDIDRWVRHDGRRLLFVYGQNDPWGAEPFHPSRHDSLTYTAPGANHGANIAALVPAEAAVATAAVQRWAGVAATAAQPQTRSALDSLNPALDRNFSNRR